MAPHDYDLRAILDAMPLMFFLKDTENRILLTNKAVADTLGVTPEDLEGTHTSQWYPDEAEGYHHDDVEVMRSKEPKLGIIEPLQVSGTEKHWIRTDKYPYYDSNGDVTGVLVFIRDATQQALAEEERRGFEERARHVQRLESLGILAGGVAHDFNNILTGIFGHCELARDALSSDSPAQEHVEQIRESARRAAGLCNQMLAYSGRGRFSVRAVCLSEVASSVSDLLKTSLARQVTVDLQLQSDLPAIEAEPSQIQQVVMNLLMNASDAIGEQDGVITLRTGVVDCDREYLSGTFVDDGLDEGRYVFIEVSDTGEGMDAEVQKKMFDPFFTTKFAGRGLGLAAVLGIVRGHRGAVDIRSEVGVGTVFRVLFPAADLVAAKEAPPRSVSGESAGQGLVLIVDDEPAVRSYARASLERSGFEVITAPDGPQALEMFRERGDEITAVLLDLTMPKMAGHEVLEELRRMRADVRVVLSSGYDEREVMVDLTPGSIGFIQKPYEPGELVRTLNDVIRSGR